MQITNFSQMREYVKSRLGHPVIDLELELDCREGFGQTEIAINDSIEWFVRENQDEGSYLDWMIVQLQPGIHTYDVPEDITEVIEAQPMYGNGFTPFTSFDVGSMESLVSTTGWAQFDLVTWVAAQQYLGDVRKYIGKKYDIRFFPQQHKMRIYPTPKANEDRMVMFRVYRRNILFELYNHILLKDLMVAKAREQWGINLTKDNHTLPGGVTVDGKGILAKAEKDMELAMKRIIEQSRKPLITLG